MSADITEERIAELRERATTGGPTKAWRRSDYLAVLDAADEAPRLRSQLAASQKLLTDTLADIAQIRASSEAFELAFQHKAQGLLLESVTRERDDAFAKLAALQSVPQGVEVPELDPGANPHQRNIDNPGSFGWILNRAFRDGYNEARKNARLVPTPPQAAPGAVDVVLDPPKSDRDCGDCTRLAICNGELACLCGPTGRMFDRKEPDHPLQPEERRVGPDEVVVPRSAAEYAILAFDWIECPDPEHYEALRAFHDALRTSAQDHNGEGAK